MKGYQILGFCWLIDVPPTPDEGDHIPFDLVDIPRPYQMVMGIWGLGTPQTVSLEWSVLTYLKDA